MNMILSPAVLATVGGGAVGFYAFHGSRRERIMASLAGMAAGYALSRVVSGMVPAATAQVQAQNA